LEESIIRLEAKDLVIVASVAAKVHSNLKWIRTNYRSPKKFGGRGPTGFTHKDIRMAFSLLYNIHEIDTNRFYKPEDLRKIVSKQMQPHKDEDGFNAQNSLPCDSSPKEIEYKDMNRALKELAKIIDLNKVKKEDIQRIAKEQHISFSGMPSLYQFNDESLKTIQYVQTKPILVNLIIKILKEMEFVNDFAFFIEGFIHWIRKESQEENDRATIHKTFDIVLNSNPPPFDIEIEKDFQLLRNYFLSIDETNVKVLAIRIVSQAVEIPQICWAFLLVSLLSVHRT
jgi:hypothetical protein